MNFRDAVKQARAGHDVARKGWTRRRARYDKHAPFELIAVPAKAGWMPSPEDRAATDWELKRG